MKTDTAGTERRHALCIRGIAYVYATESRSVRELAACGTLESEPAVLEGFGFERVHIAVEESPYGLAHEAALVETIQNASGCPTITTAQAIRQAFAHFGIKKLVLISPYVKQTNEHEVHYLTETGFTVLHELGLGLESEGYSAVTPEEWIKIVKENTRPDADGYFLSCTNTRMIEAIDDLEQDLDKPVVSSNQATLWACLKKLGITHTNKALGRLFQQN